MFDYQVEMVRGWLRNLGIEPSVRIKPWDVQGVVRWDRERGYLFLFNYHDTPRKGKVRMTLKGHPKAAFEKSFELERRSSLVVPLRLAKSKLVPDNV